MFVYTCVRIRDEDSASRPLVALDMSLRSACEGAGAGVVALDWDSTSSYLQANDGEGQLLFCT